MKIFGLILDYVNLTYYRVGIFTKLFEKTNSVIAWVAGKPSEDIYCSREQCFSGNRFMISTF